MYQLAFLLAASLSAATASAADPMDTAIIDRAVAQFTGAQIGEPGGAKLPVDPRLRLNRCASALNLEWYGRNRESVLVQCPDLGWRLFVAVSAGANAGPQAVEAAEPIIRRGERVMVVVRGAGFTLSRQGDALEEGAVGDWIRIRLAGERTGSMNAQVLRPGHVGMDLP